MMQAPPTPLEIPIDRPERTERSERSTWPARSSTPAPMTAQGKLSDLLQVMGVSSDERPLGEAYAIPLRRLRGGLTLFHEGAPAESLHIVQVGTFKCLRVAEDGYEQVLGFMGPGEVMGFDGLASGQHQTAATALEDSRVYAVPVRALDTLRQRVPAFDRALQTAISLQLARSAEIAEVMSAVAAEVRLARFLVQVSQHMAERGQSPRRLLLRMNRRDIASYLGVAHATASRSFGALADAGYLKVDNRAVDILDLDGLKVCARSTRGVAEEAGLDDLLPRKPEPAIKTWPVSPPAVR